MSIGLDEQIVIIDEAHNIEDSSRDAASVLITKYQIEQAMTDLNKLLNGKVYMKENDGKMIEVPSPEDLNICGFFVGIVNIF
jgi:Rad3-related DNA helicase